MERAALAEVLAGPPALHRVPLVKDQPEQQRTIGVGGRPMSRASVRRRFA